MKEENSINTASKNLDFQIYSTHLFLPVKWGCANLILEFFNWLSASRRPIHMNVFILMIALSSLKQQINWAYRPASTKTLSLPERLSKRWFLTKNIQMNPKQLAAKKALEKLQDGMTVGLGTGTTAYFA